MLALVCAVQSRWLTRSRRQRCGHRGEAGQAVAEYALVLLGVSTVALLVGRWAAGTDRIDNLLNGVMDRVLANAR